MFDGYFYDHKTNMCISLHSGQHITQSDAATACAGQTAHLVNIDSGEKTSFVLTWIFSNRCKFLFIAMKNYKQIILYRQKGSNFKINRL